MGATRKQAIVHAGLHRCASTSIQNLLEALRPGIEASGTDLILRSDIAGDPRLKHFRAIPRANSTGLAGWWRRNRGGAALASFSRERLLISEEALLGTMPGFREMGFYPRQNQIWAAFAGWGAYEVHPRLVVRRQDTWLESVYAFLVARGTATGFDEFFKDAEPSHMRYTALLNTLDGFNLLGRTRIGVLEDWTERGTLKSALELFDLTGNADDFHFQSHRRMPPHALPILVALNRTIGNVLGVKQQVAISSALAKLSPECRRQEIAAALESALPARIHGQIADILSAHDPALPITFTDEARTRWRTELTEDNRQFLSHPAVNMDAGIWQDD